MKTFAIFLVIILLVAGAGFFYYRTTQETIQRLTENNIIMQENVKTVERANAQNLDTINKLQTSYLEMQKEFEQTKKDFQDIRANNDRLREKFAKGNLGLLAQEKPEVVTKMINKGSAEVLRCFELLSGAPLNDKERNSKNGKEFNGNCPWLFDELVAR